MKILVIALSGIGDALMFTPALKILRKELPDAQIDTLAMFGGVKEMLERNENVNRVLYFDFLNKKTTDSIKFVFSIRKKYDASINVYPSNRKAYNIIQFLIGAKKRAAVNYLRRNLRETGFLNNITITEDDSLHNVRTNLNLAAHLLNKEISEEPDLYFPLSADDENYASEFLNKKNIKEDDFVVGFHAGCATLKNHINRRWAPEKFASLGKKLINKHDAKILLFGGPEEFELKENIKKEINSGNVFTVISDSLPQSAALVKRCNIFVTNDSGMMHIASAMKRKIVAIIGPTNINYIHPWNTEYKIVSLNLDCAPCFYYSPRPLICSRSDVQFKCVKELEVEKVYTAVLEFMN